MLEPLERLRGAIINGTLSITKRLLARYPELWLNIDPTHDGWCNLHYASFYGNYLVCFHLVLLMSKPHTRYLDIDLLTFDDLTVLHMPIVHHHLQTLHYLLQEFPKRWIDHKGGDLQRTPLQYCCMYSFADGLKLLLEFGANPRAQDANGDTCLHLCFAFGDWKCLEELVRFIVTRRLRSLFESSSTLESSIKNSDETRAALDAELQAYERIENKGGWRAVEYAASFELANRYKKQRETWIQRAVDEETVLRGSEWDNHMYFEGQLVLSAASSMGENSSSMPTSLGDILSSPMLLIQPIRQHILREPTPENFLDERAAFGRQHLRSLGEKTEIGENDTKRRRSNTTYAFGRPPARTPKSSLARLLAPATPQSSEFTKTPSLKSVMISPLVRAIKRRESSELIHTGNSPEKAEVSLVAETINSATLPGSSPFGSSYLNLAPNSTEQTLSIITDIPAIPPVLPMNVVTPTLRSSSLRFSPLNSSRRRSISTSVTQEDSSPAARAAAEAAVRSHGLLMHLGQGTFNLPNRRDTIRRNVSALALVLFTESRKLSRRPSVVDGKPKSTSLMNSPEKKFKVPIVSNLKSKEAQGSSELPLESSSVLDLTLAVQKISFNRVRNKPE